MVDCFPSWPYLWGEEKVEESTPSVCIEICFCWSLPDHLRCLHQNFKKTTLTWIDSAKYGCSCICLHFHLLNAQKYFAFHLSLTLYVLQSAHSKLVYLKWKFAMKEVTEISDGNCRENLCSYLKSTITETRKLHKNEQTIEQTIELHWFMISKLGPTQGNSRYFHFGLLTLCSIMNTISTLLISRSQNEVYWIGSWQGMKSLENSPQPEW